MAGSSPAAPLCLIVRVISLSCAACVVREVGLAADVGEAHGDPNVGLVLWGSQVVPGIR